MRTVNEQALAAVREHYERGSRAPEVIAMRTDLDIMTVERALALIAAEASPKKVSNVEILAGNLSLLQDLINTAQWEYRACPDVDNATSVTQMISTSLQTIKEIESRKDPATILNETLARAIQPLFHSIVKSLTVAAARARDELYDAVPQQQHARVDRTLKDLVASVGREVSSDYKRTVELLAEVLDCKPEDGKVQPLLQAVQTREVKDGCQETGEDGGGVAQVGRGRRLGSTVDRGV
jgi:hypothetical protein